MRKLLFTLIFSLITLVAWADTTFRLSAPSAVAVGQQFRIEYTVTARASGISVNLEDKGFDVLYGPSSSSSQSTTIVNGQMSTEVRTSFTYVLQATKEGTFQLPSATIKVDGQTLTSNSASVKVLPADKQTSAQQGGGQSGRQQQGGASAKFNKDDVHLVLDLSKTSAYEGEAIVATLKLYWRNTQMGNPSDVKLPDFEGFTVQDMDNDNAQATLEHYQGANYQMYPLARWLLFPSRSGEITIPASSLKANVQIVTTRRSGGFFDWPMEYTQNVEVPLQSAPRKVNVKALPAGKPANYMNAVGDFRVKSELTASQVKANDATIYRITIEGVGNLKYVKEPQPEFPSDFEIFDPKVDLSTKATSSGVSGRKTIEYTIIPRHAGTFTIPALQFGYFDAKSGQYKTDQTQAFTLQVEKGSGDASQQGGTTVDFSGTNQERLRVLGNDIRYLHALQADDLEKGKLNPVTNTIEPFEPFYGTVGYLITLLFPLLTFCVLVFIYRRRIRRLADVAGTRTRRAGKVAERRLKEAKKALNEKQESQFYEAIHKAILGYVGDKLRIPLSDLSQDTISETLASHNVASATIQTVKEVLDTCQFARYAPSTDSHAMDDLYKKTSDVIDSLESEIKK